LSALTGLSASFADLIPQTKLDTGWGQPIALALAIATAVQVSRRGISGLFLAGAGILAVLWIGGGLSFNEFRPPEAARYAYPVAIALILILAATFSGRLSGRWGLIASLAFLIVALPLNIWGLRSGGQANRAAAERVRAQLSILELERGAIDPEFNPGLMLPIKVGDDLRVDDYLAASDRWGSIGFPLGELSSQPPVVRTAADAFLAEAVPPRLVPTRGKPEGCTRATDVEAGAGVRVEPGSVLVADDAAELKLRRFADQFTIPAGELSASVPTSIILPVDASPQPWLATTNPLQPLKVCDPALPID
jgi:hypothetical protein